MPSRGNAGEAGGCSGASAHIICLPIDMNVRPRHINGAAIHMNGSPVPAFRRPSDIIFSSIDITNCLRHINRASDDIAGRPIAISG